MKKIDGKYLALLAAVIGIVALWGCGGGGTTNGQSTTGGREDAGSKPPWERPKASRTSPGYKEFVAKASAICNRAKLRGFRGLALYLKRHKSSGKPERQQVTEAIRTGYLPSVEKQISEIRSLQPPKGEGWQVEAFVVALKEGVRTELRTDISPGFSQAFEHSAELARALGIKACANGPGFK